ncbi:H-NS histone family protein [Solimonas marina]|uniref:H-NS histone family protein n=1 Tax=Solimonas marina TaxID=2714601 RepID=A0A969WDR0_9GAMM|nr:H-NS histone family protein [Solimonas marina]
MATYSELLKQIEALTRQAEDVRRAELDKVIAEIKEKMEQFGLTLEDLGGAKSSSRAKKSASKVAAKYRNPATGESWSGRGRTPKWLADAEAAGKSRESFAV